MMKAISVILLLSIIAVVIGLGWRSSTGTIVRSESGQTTSEMTRKPAHHEPGTAPEARKAEPQSGSTAHTRNLPQLDESAATQVPPAVLPTHLESTGHHAAEQDRRAESQVQAPADIPVLENSLVGRAFPVSASVDAGCSRYPDLCEDLYGSLERLSNEPRDEGWATTMEGKLQQLIMVKPDRFTIRALECRLSLCAIEVASLFGPLRLPDVKPLLGHELDLGDNAWGYEKTINGTVTVTLCVFERETPSNTPLQ